MKIKVQEQRKFAKSYLQIGGSNTNGTCGNGSDESTHDSYIVLDEFFNKKISSIATGDFHTIVVCEVFKQGKDETSINTNSGNTDVIGFGLNQHGQVDSMPSHDSILYPKVFLQALNYPIFVQPMKNDRTLLIYLWLHKVYNQRENFKMPEVQT